MTEKSTHFGYTQVSPEEKTKKVGQVFDSVASKYDLMNDLMSVGLHRAWKQYVNYVLPLRSGDRVLDLASGTGDLAKKFSHRVGSDGMVVLCDINRSMLSVGRERMLNNGVVGNVSYVQANGERLPFANNSFDLVSMAFGLRNVTDKQTCLESIYKVLKPGGQLMVLEFSQPRELIRGFYDFYSFNVLPRLGKWIAKDGSSYQYLAESIRMHPDQETLKQMFQHAGFEDCAYTNMTGGIVAAHRGFKF